MKMRRAFVARGHTAASWSVPERHSLPGKDRNSVAGEIPMQTLHRAQFSMLTATLSASVGRSI